MAAMQARINIVLDPELRAVIAGLARRRKASVPAVVVELIRDAVERHEDLLLARLATQRERQSRKTVRHDKAW
ncbi:MAG: hypothetical protein ACT4P2_16275 [Pseudomonadota bacterium]